MTFQARRHTSLFTIAVLLFCATLTAQTRVEPHRNSFSPSQDVQAGRQAAAQVRQQLPMLNDRATEALVERIGARLVAAVPARFQQPAFRYSFDVVNRRDINAFALIVNHSSSNPQISVSRRTR